MLNIEFIYRSVEDTAVLQCPVTGVSEDKPPDWKTRFYNGDQGQPDYTVGLVDQNHSLVITSVTLNHTAMYSCKTFSTLKSYALFVCPKSPPPASQGEKKSLSDAKIGKWVSVTSGSLSQTEPKEELLM